MGKWGNKIKKFLCITLITLFSIAVVCGDSFSEVQASIRKDLQNIQNVQTVSASFFGLGLVVYGAGSILYSVTANNYYDNIKNNSIYNLNFEDTQDAQVGMNVGISMTMIGSIVCFVSEIFWLKSFGDFVAVEQKQARLNQMVINRLYPEN